MDPIPTCPFCHVQVRPADYYCYNCGKKLQAKPPSTAVFPQALLYAGSLLLPPLGLIWAWPYLKTGDTKSRTVGWVIVVLTLISLIITLKIAVDFLNGINSQLNTQLQYLDGF